MISHSVETPRGTGAFFESLVSSPPDKGGYFPRAFISFSTLPFLTPYGHSPYMAEPHRGRGLKSSLSPYVVL